MQMQRLFLLTTLALACSGSSPRHKHAEPAAEKVLKRQENVVARRVQQRGGHEHPPQPASAVKKWDRSPVFPDSSEKGLKATHDKNKAEKAAYMAEEKKHKRMHHRHEVAKKLGRDAASNFDKPHFDSFDLMPIDGRHVDPICGSTVRASAIGLKGLRKETVSLLQEDPSWAQPGAGSVQVVANTEIGQVDGADVNVKVYKDGFYLANCIQDMMFTTHDKYGNNKDQYKGATSNTSIVLYKNMIVKEELESMTPQVCFTLCRTVPNMVFFGITNGDECYCTPWYQAEAGDSSGCDVPCVGDPTQTCGSKTKSSVYEMHLCADKPDQIKEAAMVADEVLVFMYQTVFVAGIVSDDMNTSGEKLQKIAGLGGDPTAADLGQLAKVSAGTLANFLSDGVCYPAYHGLMEAYKLTENLADADFTDQVNLAEADRVIGEMKKYAPVAETCAKKLQVEIKKSYPFYFIDLAAEDQDELDEIASKRSAAITGYYPAMYVVDKNTEPSMSTCTGKSVGMPGPLNMVECAQACDRTLFPKKCMGFQFFHMGGQADSDDFMMPLCFLFEKLETVTTYACDFIEEVTLLQGANITNQTKTANQHVRHRNATSLHHTEKKLHNQHSKKLRGKHHHGKGKGNGQGKGGQAPDGACEPVRAQVFYNGITCADFLPSASPLFQLCSKVCEKSSGAMMSASCSVKLSESTGLKLKVKKNERCFGGSTNGLVETGGMASILSSDLPADVVVPGSSNLEDPEDYIWTRDEDTYTYTYSATYSYGSYTYSYYGYY